MLVVEPHVALNGMAQVFTGAETVGGQDFADPAVEAFDHAVGLRVTRLGQAVFDVQCGTQPVKLMVATGLFLFVEQPIGEFAAIICEQGT